ncbi:MAG TPA: glutamate racemase [Patescibacteria group bacterium]
MKIGVFDSGFGGLTIFKEIHQRLPEYDYIYLGDNARSPYGSRSPELIYKFTIQAVEYLFKHNCRIIIIACNTASAEALRKLQQEYLPKEYPDRRVLGVIRPMAEEVAQVTKGRVGVIGTDGTVKSGAYIKEFEEVDPKIKVFQKASPLLVPLVEEGWHKSEVTKKVLRKYLKPLKDKRVDTLILGCTHYPVLLKDIRAIMGKNCHVPDPGKVVVDKFYDYLNRHPEIAAKLSKKGTVKFLTTNSTEKFNRIGSKLYGEQVRAEKVELD